MARQIWASGPKCVSVRVCVCLSSRAETQRETQYPPCFNFFFLLVIPYLSANQRCPFLSPPRSCPTLRVLSPLGRWRTSSWNILKTHKSSCWTRQRRRCNATTLRPVPSEVKVTASPTVLLCVAVFVSHSLWLRYQTQTNKHTGWRKSKRRVERICWAIPIRASRSCS